MTAYVSLFRAINVGGRNAVKMSILKEMHEALGFKNVSTYLQTGNVIFESDSSDAAELARQIGEEFEKKFGFYTEVMVRSAAELKEMFNQNPFRDNPEKETKWILVMFFSAGPDNEAKQALLSTFIGPEEIVIVGQEAYIYFPIGIGTSKLSTAFIEKKLKVAGTGRNWNTVTKLLEATKAIE